MQIEPLAAFLVDPDRAVRVSVPAFDSLTDESQRALRLREPLTWLHAMQPVDEHESVDAAMAASARHVERLLGEGALVERPEASLFVYRLSDDLWSQTGVVADIPVEHFLDGSVLPHEGTRPRQVAELVRYLEVVGVSSSPLAVAYRSTNRISDLVRTVELLDPTVAFDSIDGLHQEIWAVPSEMTGDFVAAFDAVDRAYITDGHHRSVAAVTYAAGQDPTRSGGRGSRQVLTVLFPDDHLRIVEFNRIVHDVPDPAPLQRTLADWGARPVQREAARPVDQGKIGVWVSGFWYSVDLPTDPSLRPPASLDPSVLQDRVLAPVLGIEDPTEDARIEYVPGSVGLSDIEHRARTGAAFLLAPVSLADMMAVSDAGGRMPPKSTYFEPKVRSGIFMVRR